MEFQVSLSEHLRTNLKKKKEGENVNAIENLKLILINRIGDTNWNNSIKFMFLLFFLIISYHLNIQIKSFDFCTHDETSIYF